jgi:hypothetical protein
LRIFTIAWGPQTTTLRSTSLLMLSANSSRSWGWRCCLIRLPRCSSMRNIGWSCFTKSYYRMRGDLRRVSIKSMRLSQLDTHSISSKILRACPNLMRKAEDLYWIVQVLPQPSGPMNLNTKMKMDLKAVQNLKNPKGSVGWPLTSREVGTLTRCRNLTRNRSFEFKRLIQNISQTKNSLFSLQRLIMTRP